MADRTIARVEPTFLDRAIATVAPQWAVQRHAARLKLAFSGGYTGARSDRRELREFYPRATSADESIIPDLYTLRARTRDLSRNEAIGGGAVENVAKNAVGSGISPHPTPDMKVLGWTEAQATDWSERWSSLFNFWADSSDADVTRTQNFWQGQYLWLYSALDSGDVFSLLPRVPLPGALFKTRYQIIEADRIASPNGDGRIAEYGAPGPDGKRQQTGELIGGVDLDKYGAPVGYCILRRQPSAIGFYSPTAEWDYYRAFGTNLGRRQVLHGFDRRRPGQTRGVPFLAPVISLVKQLGRYTDNVAMQAVLQSVFAVFITTQADPSALPAVGSGTQGKVPDMELSNGAINQLAAGEDIKMANPAAPGANFDPFVQAVVRQIGMRLSLPFEVLIMHFTASYSAARAALMVAWQFYRDRRNFVVNTFCQPIYETLLDEAVAAGLIEAPGYFTDARLRAAYCQCEWVGDAPVQIDPVKEAEGAKAKIDAGLSSRRREVMKLEGVDWRDVQRELATEHKERVAAGLEPEVTNATATEMVTPPGAPKPDDDTDTEKPENAK